MNIPDLQKKLQRRIDLVTENAQRITRIVGTLADSTDATTSGIKGREDRRPSAGLGVTNRKATQTASPVAESSNMPEGYYAGSVDRISLPNS